mgnify:CR=1 FL=1
MYKILNTTEMEDYLVQKLGNLPSVPFEWNTIEGTELSIDDCIGGKGKIAVKGNTEQKQLNGYNLYCIDDYNDTINGVNITVQDGKITLNGTATGASTIYIQPKKQFIINGEYTLEKNIVSGTHSNATCNINLRNAESSDILQGSQCTLVQTEPTNFSVETEFDTIFGIYFTKNSVFNNLVLQPMLLSGTYNLDTLPDYEPYCGGQASPNPDYPQEIKVVTGDNVVKHVGKNLFYKTVENMWYNGNLKIFSRIESTTSIADVFIGKVKPNTTYTISKATAGNRFVVLASTDEPAFGEIYVRSIKAAQNTNTTEYTFTTADNENYIMFGYYRGTDEEANTEAKKNIMLEQGSAATSYEPYKEGNYNLNLGTIELCKIGDYSDILFKNVVGDENYNAELEEGAWYKKKAIDKKVLDDSWRWFNNATNRFSVEIIAPDGNYVLSSLCDKYINAPNWTAHTNTDKSFIVRNGNWGQNKCRISFLDSDYASLAEWTQFVSENNLIVYHRLLNSTYEKITDPTLIAQLEALKKAKWFKGVNHWWIETENLEPVLKGTYKQALNESEGE